MDDGKGSEENRTYQIEGSICFMRCPPEGIPEFQLYGTYPDGDKRYVIYMAFKEVEPINLSINDSATLDDKVG